MAADRKARLIRLSPELDRALEKAAGKSMRSANAQIEMILRREMIRSGYLRDPADGEGLQEDE